ncbi:hypothetical protein WR25_25788 [Diploscapter pachys]|uniref:Uncharacterized protein n=1 Tax=Diploscapter pachys TaxID=2018661 RepID=A0A2A2JHD5_9BILA|nr:hypothetical protein WR25_25788 [Diploscapter pachys]
MVQTMSWHKADYKRTVIDPKINTMNSSYSYSTSSLPRYTTYTSSTLPKYQSSTLNSARRFASNLSSPKSPKSTKDLLKLDANDQRRFRSVETRPITTTNYWAESVKRHRDMEASRLREYLRAKESDANSIWNKPPWPGPRKDYDGMNSEELNRLSKSIENLQKAANQSSSRDDLALRMKRWNELEETNRRNQALSLANASANANNQLSAYKGYSQSMSNISKPTTMEKVEHFVTTKRTEEWERSVNRRSGGSRNRRSYGRSYNERHW